MPQNMWQDNLIRMQDYVYSPDNYDNMILGSSLTVRIVVDDKSHPDFFSLAAGGGDPFIGLEIIKKSGKKPKKIFVESNFILTKAVHDETYLTSLYLPGFYELRRVLPVFRDENQPVGILGKVIFNQMGKLSGSKASGKLMKEPNTIDTIARNRVFLMKYNDADFKKDKETINKNRVILQQYIDYFKAMGVSLCFFEMPRDCEVEKLPLTIYARAIVSEVVKKNHLEEIKIPPCEQFITMDGLHLDQKSSEAYTKYFFENARNQGQ